jgi:hypothetical protein
MKTVPNNNELNTFLNTTQQPGDDFDKDAIAGFKKLNSNQEAIDLKNNLDKEIIERGLFETSNNTKKTGWVAAAALFLVIGFSAFFIINSSTKIDNAVAVNDIVKEESTPQGAITQITPPQAITISPTELKTITKNTEEKKITITANKPDDITINNTPTRGTSATTVLEKSKETNIVDGIASNQQSVNKDQDESINSEITLAKADGKVLESEPQMPSAAPKSENSPVISNKFENNSCYYTGGSSALNTELQKKLGLKNALKPFTANLTINEKRQVTNVLFIKPNNLSRIEIETVKTQLKTLTEFNFNTQPTKKTSYTYTIIFVPKQ